MKASTQTVLIATLCVIAVGNIYLLNRQARTASSQTPRVASSTDAVARSTPSKKTLATTTVAKKPEVVQQYGVPTRLIIPKLGINAGIQNIGLKSDGSMDAPTTVEEAGWYYGSAHPGNTGVAVIDGHVAQIRSGVMTKPGIFYTLNTLSIGDTMQVVDDKGVSITFVVRAIRTFDPTADSTDIFSAKDKGAHLNIITCEGSWVPDNHSYSARLVVFADAVQ